jgi:rhodanese-related sulfurtransferase
MNTLRPEQIDTTKMPVLDVRMRPGSKQIRGARHYDPKPLLEADPLVLPLPHDVPIAVYGDSEPVVIAVVDKLRRSGYAGAARLEGGIDAWHDAGLPLEDATQEQPVPGEERAGVHRL